MPSRPSGLRIVWWIDHLGSGGSQRILTRLVEHMAQQGAKQSVICLNAAFDEELTRRITQAGAKLHIIGKQRLFIGTGMLAILQLIREQGFDVSVTFLFHADVVGTILAWLGKVPVRISAQRSSNHHYSSFRCRMIKSVLTTATLIVLNSSTYRLNAKRFLPERVPVCVIPNGVDTRAFSHSNDGPRLRESFKLPPNIPLIGCVGRLSPEKRAEDVIRALSLLKDKTPHLVLAGDGPQKTHLVRISESLNLADRVHFLGEIRDVRPILADLSVYVLASSFEGMPNSLIEAMSASCPVAVSAIDPNLDLIGRDERGWSFPYGDSQVLAETIDLILVSPERVSTRIRAARQHIKKCYPEKNMLRAWQLVLEKNTTRSLQL
jgi:glycosyltransferase involved in cell wall biosynthesis